MASSASRRSEI
ncbi:hypothetical protein YPPY60_3371, partial [Yersinia pestis PY-60]